MIATAVTAPTSSVPSWPANGWATWTPTHDRFMAENPVDFMQAAPIAPNAEAVAQADFAFGGNYMAHGSLDVFKGAQLAQYSSLDGALAGARGETGLGDIVGVFAEGDSFVVRSLLVSGADRRGAGDDVRDPRPAPRARPDELVKLRPIGEPNGSWGHGDFRSLSALRFVDGSLLAFVGADHLVER